jgi:tRNA(adenine34) deaminase
MKPLSDADYMTRALALAAEAAAIGEVPVGAVVVHDGVIVGEGYNRREVDRDPLAHAEILAIAQAAKALQRWRLIGCTLYVTLEPCPMCAGAIVNARVDTLVYGARDPRAGAVDTHYGIGKGPPLNHVAAVREGVLAEPCAAALKSFFASRRGNKAPA